MKIGFIVNPYAGLGGQAGLKGSDGQETRRQALTYHQMNPKGEHQAEFHASKRCKRFFSHFDSLLNQSESLPSQTFEFIMMEGELGAEYFSLDCPNQLIESFPLEQNGQDTQKACQSIVAYGVDLLLFLGGDGTARDVLDGLRNIEKPLQICLGIPSGVKMQSGVFAISPESAAEMLFELLNRELNVASLQDVRDIDEAALREGKVQSSFYGELKTLFSPRYLQHLKQAGAENDDLVIDDILTYLADEIITESACLVGPGSTFYSLLERMNMPGTLVGFDALVNGELVQSDLNAEQCLAFFGDYPNAKLLISPTPNQGFLFGRGNQQITHQLLKRLDLQQQLIIVATKNKLQNLEKRPLLLDTDNPELEAELTGLYPVLVAYDEWVVYPVSSTY